MPSVGELFVSLGIKGSDKTVGALKDVKSGMGGIASTSIEAKAAIVGAMYALERAFAISGAMGTNLTNMNALLGVSITELQKWQNAGRQVGVSNESMTSSFKSISQAMASMNIGKSQPEGFNMVRAKVGLDFNRAKHDTQYVMEQLQKYVQAETDVGRRNLIARTFNLGDDIIAGMARGGFTQEALSRAAKMPHYSEGETKSLDKSNIAWANLGDKVEKAMGHFNAAHGQEIVKDFTQLVDVVLKLAGAFETLSEKIKLFAVIGKVFEGWGLIFDSISSGVDKLTGLAGTATDKKGNLKTNPVDMISGWVGSKIDNYFADKASLGSSLGKDLVITPNEPLERNNPNIVNNNQNINVIHHGDAKDTHAVKQSHAAAARESYWQRANATRKGS